MSRRLPRYPIYIPSRGRYKYCQTAKFLIRDGVPFRLVVEPYEREKYAIRFREERILVLPFTGKGLIDTRNWIKERSIKEGYERHWQIDDNIADIQRFYRGERLHCRAGVALAATEDFVDRYENIAVAGLNYVMFGIAPKKPFLLNAHVYSCSLILNSIPHRWRSFYNDDTDLCLQVLADGWCTVLFNAFMIQKKATMEVKGGNTDIYYGDGRLKMARSLERLWPGVVETKRRFNRPQHVIHNSWKKFDTPLKRKPGIDFDNMQPNEYGMKLKQLKPIKSKSLRDFFKTSSMPK